MKANNPQRVLAAVIANEVTAMLRKGIIKNQLDNEAILSLLSDLTADMTASIDRQFNDNGSSLERFVNLFKKFYEIIDKEDFRRLAYSGLGLANTLSAVEQQQTELELQQIEQLFQKNIYGAERTIAEIDAMDHHANELYEEVAAYIIKRLDTNITIEDLITALVIPASTYVKGIELFSTEEYPADEFFIALLEDNYVYYTTINH